MRKLVIAALVAVALAVLVDRNLIQPFRDSKQLRAEYMRPASPPGCLTADELKAKIIAEEGPGAADPPPTTAPAL